MTNIFILTNGDRYQTKLDEATFMSRLTNLTTLAAIVEGAAYEGAAIYRRANLALSKCENFTGMIRLTELEKDFLQSIRNENDMLDELDQEVLDHYINRNKDNYEYLMSNGDYIFSRLGYKEANDRYNMIQILKTVLMRYSNDIQARKIYAANFDIFNPDYTKFTGIIKLSKDDRIFLDAIANTGFQETDEELEVLDHYINLGTNVPTISKRKE